MIDRYWLEPLKTLWSEEEKFRSWLNVELAVVDFLHKKGLVTASERKTIHRRAAFSVKKINRLERTLQHDVIAFVTNVEESIGKAGRWIHFGLTSSDVVDTALSLRLHAALNAISSVGEETLRTLRPLVHRYADQPIMGRTHGVYAEPMSLGFKFFVFYSELSRRLDHLNEAKELSRIGKLSGAVGMNVYYSPADEKWILRRLGLKQSQDATQILPRDIFAQVSASLALLASSLERFALEIRLLHRSEVREIQEGFGKGQRGSSAMPHKKNPVLCERISGLARVARSLAIAQFETVALWHERDLTNSSTERFTIPDQTSLVFYMLHLMKKVLANLQVNIPHIAENMKKAGGVYWSGYLLNRLIRKGWSRDRAYPIVQSVALRCVDERIDFLTAVRQDPRLTAAFTPRELSELTESVFWRNSKIKMKI